MISQGVDIVWLSKTLDHKDASITLSTYTKLAIAVAKQSFLENLSKKMKQQGFRN